VLKIRLDHLTVYFFFFSGTFSFLFISSFSFVHISCYIYLFMLLHEMYGKVPASTAFTVLYIGFGAKLDTPRCFIFF
jgi:hypothetical protein